MPGNVRNVSFTDPYAVDAERIRRQQMLAMQLQQQAEQPLPGGQMAGGYYVPTSPLSHLAKALKGATARADISRGDEELRALSQRSQSDLDTTLAESERLRTGTPGMPAIPSPPDEIGGGPGAPAQAPQPGNDLAAALRLLRHPTTAPLGMQQYGQAMNNDALVRALSGGGSQPQVPPQAAPAGPMPQGTPAQAPPTQGARVPIPGLPPIPLLNAGPQGTAVWKEMAERGRETPQMRNVRAAGYDPTSQQGRGMLGDTTAAEEVKLFNEPAIWKVPGTSKEVQVTKAVLNAITTGVAHDERTAEVAAKVLTREGLPATIGVKWSPPAPGTQSGAGLSEEEKAGRIAAEKTVAEMIPKELSEARDRAQSSVERINTAHRIAEVLHNDKTIQGPAADIRTVWQRVGEMAFGPGQAKSLEDTIQLVQGLAELELKSAGALKGQGSVTENERILLRKATSAPNTLSKPELLKLMQIFDKTARYDIKQYEGRYERAKAAKMPNLEYWGGISAPGAFPMPGGGTAGQGAASATELSPEARELLQRHGLRIP